MVFGESTVATKKDTFLQKIFVAIFFSCSIDSRGIFCDVLFGGCELKFSMIKILKNIFCNFV